MADREVEAIINEELARCKKLIADHKDAVEGLTNALLERDSVDIIQIKKILGEKPFEEDDMLKKVIEEVIFL